MISAFSLAVTEFGIARRHRDANALEQIADRQRVPVVHELRALQRRGEPVAGQSSRWHSEQFLVYDRAADLACSSV